MGRSGITEGTGMFQRDIQYAQVLAQTEAFVQRYLAGVLVQLAFDDEGRLSLAGVDLDDAIRQIAIFY